MIKGEITEMNIFFNNRTRWARSSIVTADLQGFSHTTVFRVYTELMQQRKEPSIGHSQYSSLDYSKKKKKETTGVLTSKHTTEQPRQTTAANSRNIVKTV